MMNVDTYTNRDKDNELKLEAYRVEIKALKEHISELTRLLELEKARCSS